MELEGRSVVITGASRGLGAGMAQYFHEQGMRLGLCARSAPVLDESARVLSRRLDVRDRSAMDGFCDEVTARFGHIDLWINNAGVLEPVKPVRELDDAALMDHLQVNLLGVLHGSQAYIRHLRQRSDEHEISVEAGVLINISSGAAQKGYAGWGAYCAAKAGVDRLTECIQLEEQTVGLRAHAVAPGVIDTDMQALVRSSDPAAFPAVQRFVELKKHDRFNSPAFVAAQLLSIAFDPAARPQRVVLRLPDAWAA